MKYGVVLPVLIGAGLLGWFAPDLAGGTGGEASAARSAAGAEPGARDPATARKRTTWAPDPTVLTRQPDGHFYANVLVEDTEHRFLVDTGASIVALTGEDAETIGLAWDEGSLQRIGRGASGPVYGVPVTIPRMELGGHEARDVEAAIIPEGLGVSLLGQSFLSRIDHVRISGDEMRLGE